MKLEIAVAVLLPLLSAGQDFCATLTDAYMRQIYRCCETHNGDHVSAGAEWWSGGRKFACREGRREAVEGGRAPEPWRAPASPAWSSASSFSNDPDACSDHRNPQRARCCWVAGRWVREGAERVRGSVLQRCQWGREEEVACAHNGRVASSYDDNGYRFRCQKDSRGYSFKMSHCIDPRGVARSEGEGWENDTGDRFWYRCERSGRDQLRKTAAGCLSSEGRQRLSIGARDYDRRSGSTSVCTRRQDGAIALVIDITASSRDRTPSRRQSWSGTSRGSRTSSDWNAGGSGWQAPLPATTENPHWVLVNGRWVERQQRRPSNTNVPRSRSRAAEAAANNGYVFEGGRWVEFVEEARAQTSVAAQGEGEDPYWRWDGRRWVQRTPLHST